MEQSQRGRGRPAKEHALTGADRAKRYREKQKAAGLIKRYVVTENTNSVQEMREVLSKAIAARDFFKSEVERLHAENEKLWAESKKTEQHLSITTKELIVTRDKLSALRKLKGAV